MSGIGHVFVVMVAFVVVSGCQKTAPVRPVSPEHQTKTSKQALAERSYPVIELNQRSKDGVPFGTVLTVKKSSSLSCLITDDKGKVIIGATIVLRHNGKTRTAISQTLAPVRITVPWQGRAKLAVYYMDKEVANTEVNLSRDAPVLVRFAIDTTDISDIILL